MKKLPRVIVVLLLAAVGMGSRSCGEKRPATLTCGNKSYEVRPDGCVPLSNPCVDGVWKNFDVFRLCDPPAGVYVRTSASGTRELCVTSEAGVLINKVVDYVFGRGNGFGEGTFFVTTKNPMTARAEAVPAIINNGESSQLRVAVEGGIPPFTYSWVPVSTLNRPNVADPVAMPSVTTTYSVTVGDSAGQSVVASVTVKVGFSVIVTANPPAMDPGGTSGVFALPIGGTPPYTYVWVPTDTLDDPTDQFPLASPLVTTTYTVTVTDSVGTEVTDAVTVTLNLLATAEANPGSIDAGESSQLLARVKGGSPSYTYAWTPADTLSAADSASPVARPAVTTTYQVLVTDQVGTTATHSTTVTVGSSGPTASFTFTWSSEGLISLDASASTGTITLYHWEFSWDPTIKNVTKPKTTFFEDDPTTVGTITLTVTDADGLTASTSRPFP